MAAAVGAIALLGCGSPGAGAPGGASPGAGLRGSLTVFAAASLTEALADDRGRLLSANRGLDVRFSFAGSQQLVAQIQAGAPADVVATADEATMQRLVAGNLVETPTTIAHNHLQVVVARGNPRSVRGLADLGRADLRVVLEDPAVPAGRYARQALERQGTKVTPVSLELDVKSAVQKVESGEADAAIVYVTDVRSAGSRVTGVAIPADQNVVATYQAAVVRATANVTAARAFVIQLESGTGQEALRARGFASP